MLKQMIIQKWLFITLLAFNPRTYTLIHTPTVVQVGVGGGSLDPPPEFLICCSILKCIHVG